MALNLTSDFSTFSGEQISRDNILKMSGDVRQQSFIPMIVLANYRRVNCTMLYVALQQEAFRILLALVEENEECLVVILADSVIARR